MARPSSHLLELARRGAVLRVRELAYELNLLLNLFPDVRDAFDPDELPVDFIVNRDAWTASSDTAAPKKARPGAARTTVGRRGKKDPLARRSEAK